MKIQLQLILIIYIVNFELVFIQSQEEMWQNLLGSIIKNDGTKQGEFYIKSLNQEVNKKQHDFDMMERELFITRHKHSIKNKHFAQMDTNQDIVAAKREINEENSNREFDDLSINMISLEDIRISKKVYVDKTRYIVDLLSMRGTFQLLIRPRRFGKTLFLNTVWDVLLGHRHLFENTYIEQNYDWTTNYIVIKFEFHQKHDLNNFYSIIERIARKYNIVLDSHINKTSPDYFSFIITDMYKIKGIHNIAFLVDEYDMPLLNTDSNVVNYYIIFLQNLKILIQNKYLKFVIMTGCTSINNLMVDNADNTSKISISSKINIIDISTQNKYHGICGYTENEIWKYYEHHINRIMMRHNRTKMDVQDEIRKWYNGYKFSGTTTDPTLYNPMSILQYFKLVQFEGGSFWAFKSDHPRLAIQRYLQVAIANGDSLLDLDQNKLTYSQLYEDIVNPNQDKKIENFNFQKSSLESLLFQAGYLTIISYDLSKNTYALGIPNIEVQREFHKIVGEVMKSSTSCVNYGKQIIKNFNDLKFQKFVELYNNFVQKKYEMRIWASAKDKEKTCQLMFGTALMLSDEFDEIIYEKNTSKRDTKKKEYIDIYLEKDQKYKAIVECKYDNEDMEACMKQVENYNLPTMEIKKTLPIIRMCINFIEGKIERVVARKYNTKDIFIEAISEYIVKKDEYFPHKCDFPECKSSFKTQKSLNSHIGHHNRGKKLPPQSDK